MLWFGNGVASDTEMLLLLVYKTQRACISLLFSFSPTRLACQRLLHFDSLVLVRLRYATHASGWTVWPLSYHPGAQEVSLLSGWCWHLSFPWWWNWVLVKRVQNLYWTSKVVVVSLSVGTSTDWSSDFRGSIEIVREFVGQKLSGRLCSIRSSLRGPMQ